MAEPIDELSVAARQRMAAMLPDLLAAVRWRRRRRVAVRTSLAAAAAVLLCTWIWSRTTSRFVVERPDVRGGAACEVVRTAPDVLAAYRADVAIPADWYIGDDDLQEFLRLGERPEGIVRVGRKVMVASAAIDPLPRPQASMLE